MGSLPTPIIPKALQPGDTIAFISPSARLNDQLPTPLSRGIKFFESRGYQVKTIYSPLPTPKSTSTPIFFAHGRHVADEIHKAFLDPKVTCIISTIGGTTINQALRHINYETIRKNPKIFVGYSDNTLLVYAFFVKAGLRSFYGPCVFTEFAEFPAPHAFTAEHFFQVLLGKTASNGGVGITGQQIPFSSSFSDLDVPFLADGQKEDSQALRVKAPTPPPVWVRPGTATGPIFGGCLHKLVALCGSPFFDLSMHKGAILFFEIAAGDGGAKPLFRNRADMVDLINVGLFDHIVGLVVGRTIQYDAKMNQELQDMVSEVMDGAGEGGYKIPILMGVDVGHTSPMLTVPFGARARLDSEKGEFVFVEEGVI